MCSTGPFNLLGDWKDISIAHVIIIIKSEVSTFPIVIIFFRSCVPEMFVTSYSVTYCIYVPGNREFVFIISVQLMMSANIWISFGLQIVLVCLYSTPSHYHHCANLSEGIVRYILSSVWVRLSIFSPLSIIQYVGLYVFSLPISIVMIEIICSISQEICTRFCCTLLCCGYVIVHNEFTWSIYPYSSGLFCWHWGNR